MIVAQISDMHVKRRGYMSPHMPHVVRPLRKAIQAIARLRPRVDCIVATGDLTETGAPLEYRRLRDILSESSVPVYLIPGNHDNRAALRAAFPDHRYLHENLFALHFTIESERLRIVVLDSSTPGHSGGSLDDVALRWLDTRLEERPRTPTIVALHHPPFPTGVRRFDRQRFEGRESLGEIVRKHLQIRRIVCGHVHQPIAAVWCGRICVSAPSTAPTLTLSPQRSGLGWEPGGFLIHRLHAGELTTTVVRTANLLLDKAAG